MRSFIPAFVMLLAPALLAQTPVETVNWTNGVSYTYDGSGNVHRIGSDTFVYDHAGRLVQADVNGVRRVHEYDAFGNRTKCTQAPGTIDQSDCQSGIGADTDGNRNRLALEYDAAGNVKALGGHRYSHDAMNMIAREDFGQLSREFLYTASDERIAVHVPGSSTLWTIRDASGKVLREFTSRTTSNDLGTASWAWAKDYIWRDGHLLASRQPGSNTISTLHYHLDHLGTPRRITDQADRIVGFHDYHAFGTETNNGQHEEPLTRMKYTGHERDIWLGDSAGTLDYMHARYYSSVLGRFLSIDPGRDSTARQPQSWNQYSYVRNNPFNGVDPDGRATVVVRENGRRRYALDRDEDGVADELQGADPPRNPCGIFGCSDFFDVGRIDRVMTATLGLINNVGLTLLENLAPGPRGSSATRRRAAGAGIRVTEKGLAIVERHLLRFGVTPENSAMLKRLRSALDTGRRVTSADANFYMHELAEATMVARGMSDEAAHAAALQKYNMSPFSVYHPEVIKAFPEQFNDNWLAFWGLK